MIWNNKIESSDRFTHIGRFGHFICYYGDDEWVYPADPTLGWLTRMDEHTRWLKSDCKKLHDIYFDYKTTKTEFKTLYVNPYFYTL